MDAHSSNNTHDVHNALFKQFTEIMSQNERLAQQNRLFQSYLARYEQNNPDDQFTDVKRRRNAPTSLVLDQMISIAVQENEYRKNQLTVRYIFI